MKANVKFRAWDEKYKVMRYKVLVGNTLDEEFYTAHAFWVTPETVDYKCEPHWSHFDELSDVVLEQWSGIKDITGKDIYEGDIVEGDSWKEPIAMKTKKTVRGLVENTMAYGFTFCTKGSDGKYKGLPSGYRTYPNLKECKVIGNIHESPELLDEDIK